MVTQRDPSPHRRPMPRLLSALALALSLVGALLPAGAPAARAQGHTGRGATTACRNCGPYGDTYGDGTQPSFVHTATSSNSYYDYTLLDNPYTNGQANLVLMVTQLWSGVYNNHNIGVWYTGWQWAIFNQDGSPIPAGAQFNVSLAGSNANCHVLAYLQQATSGNTVGDYTVLDTAYTDDNPSATMILTPVYGATFQYENHPIGVWYITGSRWAIFNEDGTPMTVGEQFDVAIWGNDTPCGAFDSSITTTPANTTGDSSQLFGSGNDSQWMIWVTHNWGTTGPANNHPIGVWYEPFGNGAGWYVFEEDRAAMPIGLTFNVTVEP